MKNTKIWLCAGLSFIFAQIAHAIVIVPPGPPAVMSNCDITQQNNSSPPAILNDKAQLQTQLCILQNTAKAQQQSIQNLQQSLLSTQSQIQALQQKMAATKSHGKASFNWESTSMGSLPHHAFVAAENAGNKLYICQANYKMNPGDLGSGTIYLYPGMLTSQGCVISFAGNSYVENPYKILVSKETGYWGASSELVDANNAELPFPAVSFQETASNNQGSAQPIIGGYEPDHYIYICRVNINNTYYVGKVVSGNCNIALHGKEASWPDYQVLLTGQPTGYSSS
jgi:hypothetical protein